jgi:6-pyruvoyltetrahydropterin/6-carboxytetrahydropterin synthase
MLVSVCRKAHFNAAHRLFNPAFSDAENERIFGKCNNPNYHGHNYTIEVWVKGKIDADTGYVMDLKILKELIEHEIEDRFDHKNLNLDTQEFKNLIPTAENICVVCWQLLRTRIDAALSLKIRLYETERNVVEFDGL